MTIPPTIRSCATRTRLSAALAATLLALTLHSLPAAASDALAQRAGETAWVRESAESWRRILLAQAITYSSADLPDAATRQRLVSAWEGAVTTVFSADKLAADVETVLALAFKPEELKEVAAFYDTALGRRIHAAEQPAAPDRAALVREKAELSAAVRRLHADKKRREVIARLADAMGGVEGEIDALTVVSNGAAVGMLAAIPAGKPRAETVDLDAMTATRRAGLRAALEPLLLPSIERRYARFTLAELKTYATELSSPLAKRFALMVRAATNEALRRQAVAIGQSFSKRLNAQSL